MLEPLPVPLREDAAGVVRVGRTRVALETVLWAWRDGATPEGIAESYPAIPLADVYAAVAYALARPDEATAYLLRADSEERSVLHGFDGAFPQRGLREPLIERSGRPTGPDPLVEPG